MFPQELGLAPAREPVSRPQVDSQPAPAKHCDTVGQLSVSPPQAHMDMHPQLERRWRKAGEVGGGTAFGRRAPQRSSGRTAIRGAQEAPCGTSSRDPWPAGKDTD